MTLKVAQNITDQVSVTTLEATNDYMENNFFKDNLEHLEYLEYIARLKLVTTYLANFKSTDNEHPSLINDIRRYLANGLVA